MYKANKILFIVFKTILLILLSYNFYYLYTYRNFKENKNSIEYTLLTSTKHSGGKGKHYSMDILYNDGSHHLSLTSQEYRNLNNNEYPAVYFYQDELLTDWSYEQHKRYLYVLFFLLIISVFSNVMYCRNKQVTLKNQ